MYVKEGLFLGCMALSALCFLIEDRKLAAVKKLKRERLRAERNKAEIEELRKMYVKALRGV